MSVSVALTAILQGQTGLQHKEEEQKKHNIVPVYSMYQIPVMYIQCTYTHNNIIIRIHTHACIYWLQA